VWGSARSFEYSIEPEDNDNPEEKQSGDDDSRMTAQKKSRAEMITTQRKSRTELKIITTQTTRLSQRRRNSFSASHKQFLRLSQAEKQAHLAHMSIGGQRIYVKYITKGRQRIGVNGTKQRDPDNGYCIAKQMD
jgi:hypothetical protein